MIMCTRDLILAIVATLLFAPFANAGEYNKCDKQLTIATAPVVIAAAPQVIYQAVPVVVQAAPVTVQAVQVQAVCTQTVYAASLRKPNLRERIANRLETAKAKRQANKSYRNSQVATFNAVAVPVYATGVCSGAESD